MGLERCLQSSLSFTDFELGFPSVPLEEDEDEDEETIESDRGSEERLAMREHIAESREDCNRKRVSDSALFMLRLYAPHITCCNGSRKVSLFFFFFFLFYSIGLLQRTVAL